MKKRFVSIMFLFVLVCLCLSFVFAACVQDEDITFEVTVKEGSGYTVQGISADGYKKGAEIAFKVNVTDETKQIKEVLANDQALTLGADGNYKFTMPEKDVEISVVLEDKAPVLPSTFEVTVKEGAGYSVQGISADSYKKGAEVTFKVNVTDETKQIKEVLANDQALTLGADGNYKFTMPEKDVEISVVLEDKAPVLPSTFEVTVKEGSGYTVQGINANGYEEGAEVAFKVEISDETKQIKKVLAIDQALTADADGYYKFTMPEKDVEISVVLEDKTPVLSLSETSLALNVQANNTASVTATVTPSQDAHELEWISGDENIATVTANGRTAEITAVGKGTTTISVSFKGLDNAEAAEITVSVINVRPWTEAEEAAMKAHLHDIVLYPTEIEDMEAKWEAQYGQITISGGWVEGNELAEYASQYTTEDGWIDVSHWYAEEEAYIFEKAVEVSQETRYVRVFIYAIEDESSGLLSQEGSFYITAYDPYVYEWPADYLQAALKEVLSTEVIPSVPAQHYYIYNYSVTAYYNSTEEDGGYGAILEAADYTVEEKDGYYTAVSPDEMFTLAYAYKNGTLQIEIRYNMTSDWPAKAVENAFVYYQSVNPTAFVLPVFEGDGVSFMFADGYYNKFWINEGKERDMYGTITVSSSTQALTDTYIQKLLDNGWVKVGNDGMYVKPIAESNQVNKIAVTYSEQDEVTAITVYYFSIKDPTQGWNDDAIKENNTFYKYKTDILPAYTGEITAFSADKDTVYLTVPEEDFADLLETYKQILVDAGYILEGTSTWTQKYVSPNRQFSVKPSVRSSTPNTIQIYFSEEMPSEWSNERIKDSLQLIGSSLESIPMFESETSFLCLCEIKKNYDTTPTSDYLRITISASDSSQTLTQADVDAYMAILAADDGWTLQTEGGNVFVGSDGQTTITVSLSYGSITVAIKYVAA